MKLWRLLYLALLWTPTGGQDQDQVSQVSCVFMETCLLPCSFEPEEDDEISLIEWIKLEGDYLVHAYKPRQDLMDGQSAPFRGRTSLFQEQTSGGNASLQLSAVTVEDEGTYRCLAVATSESGVEEWMNLRVEGPVAALKMELKGDVLVCSAEGIYPKPNVSWAPHALPKTKLPQKENQLYSVSSSLLLDLRSTQSYTCNVSTYHSWKSATYSLQSPVKMSGVTTIPCVASMVPEKSLVWTFIDLHADKETIVSRSGAEVEYAAPWRPFVANVSDSGSLNLKELSEEQEGVYICELSTGNHTYISRTELRLPDPPDPVVIAVPVVLAVLIGLCIFVVWKYGRHKCLKKPKQPKEEDILLHEKSHTVDGMLQQTINDLTEEELNKFKRCLTDKNCLKEHPIIPVNELEKENISEVMTNIHGIYSICVTKRILQRMPGRRSMLKRLEMSYNPEEVIEKCKTGVKSTLREKFRSCIEGFYSSIEMMELKEYFTELYVIPEASGKDCGGHEVIQMEAHFRDLGQGRSVPYQDIFRERTKSGAPVRVVLTKARAGLGKTVLTQKFCLDWAEGNANEDIQLLFPFTFRELNVLKDDQFSLVELLHHLRPETNELHSFQRLKVLFIFDGLDECKLPLDLVRTRNLTDPNERVSVEVLLINLIRGNLLPSAQLWITTRPTTVFQIPDENVSMVTEVRGFSDPQKEQYFRYRFKNEQEATSVISHIKSIHSIHIMCNIPVFCCILSTVMQHLIDTKDQFPQTLTQIYICFLVVQPKTKDLFPTMVRSLGKLAFEHLQKESLIFYESDLSECGLDVEAVSEYSRWFPQVFREEPIRGQDKVYCFIHLSVQEFFAALHVQETFLSSGENLLSKPSTDGRVSEADFYSSAVSIALESSNGHLDLFLRFLLGLSLPTNQSILTGFLSQTEGTSLIKQSLQPGVFTQSRRSRVSSQYLDLKPLIEEESIAPSKEYLQPGLLTQGRSTSNSSLLSNLTILTESKSLTSEHTVQFIKETLNSSLQVSEERRLNLLHCLNELKDDSLLEQIREWMRTGPSNKDFSPADWLSLSFILLHSDSDLDQFELRKYQASEDALLNLLQVIRTSNKAILCGCNLTSLSCEHLASVLSSSRMTLLDLSYNNLQDSGVERLCKGLQSTTCRLQTLRLSHCSLSHYSCAPLATVLCSSSLTHLDLSNNDLRDSGVEQLCSGLKSALCRLTILRLSGCLLSKKGGASLASALKSSSSKLRELDLTYNHLEPSMKHLTALQAPNGPLGTLRLEPYGEKWRVRGLRKYFCNFTLDRNTAHRGLCLSDGDRTVTCVKEEQNPCDHEDRFTDCPQVLSSTGLSGRCYWEVDFRRVEKNVEKNVWVTIAVSYREIRRKGAEDECRFGNNHQSWTLWIWRRQYYVCHNNKRRKVFDYPLPSDHKGVFSEIDVFSGRVGVFLDSEAGELSFYRVEKEELIHLHTFSGSFTEPLFPGFGLMTENSAVSLVNLKY